MTSRQLYFIYLQISSLKFHSSLIYTSHSYDITQLTYSSQYTVKMRINSFRYQHTLSSFELTHFYSKLHSKLMVPKWILFQPLLPDFKKIQLYLETDSECIPATSQHHHHVKEQMLRLHWHFPVIKGLWFYWIQLSRELEEITEQLHTRQFTLTIQLMHVPRLI